MRQDGTFRLTSGTFKLLMMKAGIAVHYIQLNISNHIVYDCFLLNWFESKNEAVWFRESCENTVVEHYRIIELFDKIFFCGL